MKNRSKKILFALAILTAGLIITIVTINVTALPDDVEISEPSVQDTSVAPIANIKPKPIPEAVEETICETEPTTIYYECPLSHDLQDYIRTLCDENGVPMVVVVALIEVESRFRSNIISDTNDYGLMQINKINHENFSKEYGITDFLNPYENVFCGITMLSRLYDIYHDTDKVLMAYNLGATGAKRLWDKGIYESSYSRKILSVMEVYESEIK